VDASFSNQRETQINGVRAFGTARWRMSFIADGNGLDLSVSIRGTIQNERFVHSYFAIACLLAWEGVNNQLS
jgi:hypothetical protein